MEPSSSSEVGDGFPVAPVRALAESDGNSLVTASINAMVCSAVDTVGDSGPLHTTTPAADAGRHIDVVEADPHPRHDT